MNPEEITSPSTQTNKKDIMHRNSQASNLEVESVRPWCSDVPVGCSWANNVRRRDGRTLDRAERVSQEFSRA